MAKQQSNTTIPIRYVTTCGKYANALVKYSVPSKDFLNSYPKVDTSELNPQIIVVYLGGSIYDNNNKIKYKPTNDSNIWEGDSSHIKKLAIANILKKHCWANK